MDLNALFSSPDAVLLIAFAASLLLHVLFVRRSRLVVNIVAIYASFGTLVILPFFHEQVALFVERLADWRWISFIVATIIVNIVFSHSVILSISQRVSPSSIGVLLTYRAVIVGVFFAGALYLMPPSLQDMFHPIVRQLFVTPLAMIIWLILPFFMAFSYRFRTDRGWLP